MYFPEFFISTKILKAIAQIEAARAILGVTPILPSIKKSIQRETAVKNVYFLNHFEGVTIPFEQLKAYFDGKTLNTPERTIREITNAKNALALISKNMGVTELSLRTFHKTLLNQIAPEKRVGVYRETTLNIRNTNITSPAPDEILAQLVSFFSWFQSGESVELPSPLRAAILYFEILRIQPFETENKKVAGLMALLNLFLEEYDEDQLLCFEGYFDESPTSFYTAVRTYQNDNGDLTKWLEYFLSGLQEEYQKLKERVVRLAKDNKLREIAGMISLNDRQERILEFLSDYGNMQNKDFVRLLPDVSEDTILRDLKGLIEKKLISKKGSTKSAQYFLINRSSR